jgi:cytochrome c oxidase cbb3-type subunit 3
MAEKHIDEVTGIETTGHEWDGVRELNNPLPNWWRPSFGRLGISSPIRHGRY